MNWYTLKDINEFKASEYSLRELSPVWLIRTNFHFFYQFFLIQKKRTYKAFQLKKIMYKDQFPNDPEYRGQTTF